MKVVLALAFVAIAYFGYTAFIEYLLVNLDWFVTYPREGARWLAFLLILISAGSAITSGVTQGIMESRR